MILPYFQVIFNNQNMVCFENDSVYKLGASFTMRNILSIIDKMSVAIPHHDFEAEPIGEGGIRMKGYTAGAPFKTIRFNFDNWPWCPDGVENEDLDRRLIVNDFTGKKRLYSNFRSLYGAPEWTKDEVECVNGILCEEGMKRVRA